MKIAIVGIVGVPASYGGFETLVEQLISHNFEVATRKKYTVFCSSSAYEKKVSTYKGAEITYINFRANGIQSILYDGYAMLQSMRSHDVILVLGVSGSIFLPFIRMLSKSKIIVNVDGIESRRQKWSNFIQKFLSISEYFAIKFSHAIVADNAEIQKYLLERYTANSELISYGGDHVLQSPQTDVHISKPENFALGLCRIEPENNVEIILDAFSVSGKNLVFIGNWDNSLYGINLYTKYKNYDNIQLINPIYDTERLFEYRSSCNLYVHGHSAGGTNPSLVEMLFFDVPIIAFDCKFNRNTTFNKCEYFSDKSDLVDFLANSSYSARMEWEEKYREAREIYTWANVSEQYDNLFRRIHENGK